MGPGLIKAVLFDFGQTLVDSAQGFRQAEKAAQEKVLKDLRRSRPNLPRSAFMERYRELRRRFQAQSDFSRRNMWDAVADAFDAVVDGQQLRQWEQAYWQTVAGQTRVFAEAMNVLKRLRAFYRLGLVTNTQGQPAAATHRLRHYPDLASRFEEVVVAGCDGIPPKPDPLPFQVCLERMGLAPADAVYVGDDWRIDVCGAGAAGLKAVWIKHRSVQRRWPDVDTAGVPVIADLNGLWDVLV